MKFWLTVVAVFSLGSFFVTLLAYTGLPYSATPLSQGRAYELRRTPAPTATARPPLPTPTPARPTPTPAPTPTPVRIPTSTVGPVSSVPSSELPHRFAGTASINGVSVPDGTTVNAVIDGAVTTSVSTTRGSYRIDVVQLPGKSYTGKTVSFTVGGLAAAQTAAWERGGVTILDLTATS